MCDLRLSGAIASRAKIGSWITFTVASTTLVYFPLAHMVWGGTVVHISAGTAAFEEAGVQGITVTEAQGRGRQRASVEYYRGARYSSPYVAKLKLEVVVTDTQLDAAINAILGAAYTGEVGDGKIWVSPVERVIRVRARETDEQAIVD